MTAYYNEIDPYAAQWLRNLIAAGHIAPGDVDERSIIDVKPDDLRPYTQCHFFAGVGVWSRALRGAGWSDDRPVWTGSCPCQPFSSAGRGDGFVDERHLWPHWFHLITHCEPSRIFGEQVASKDGLGWLDLVQTDLEGAAYTNGAVDICAAGVGAPHIRQRLWFVAERLDNTTGSRYERAIKESESETRDEARVRLSGSGCGSSRLADARLPKPPGRELSTQNGSRGDGSGVVSVNVPAPHGSTGRVADANYAGSQPGREGSEAARHGGALDAAGRISRLANSELQQRQGSTPRGNEEGGRYQESTAIAGLCSDSGPGPTNGFWRDVDWLGCRDGKWRPVEPGTFPLANGVTNRVGRLRAYGNAINAEVAKTFIEAYLECK